MSATAQSLIAPITLSQGSRRGSPPRVQVDDLATRLKSVSSFLQSGAVFHSGTIQLPPGGASIFYASHKGEGRLQIPGASATDIKRLIQACDRASFRGQAQDDAAIDCGAWKLDTKDFSCQFALPYTLCAEISALMLGALAETFVLDFELYQLNVYGPGSFLAAHVDNLQQTDMIGSLVITLPTEHEGGGLILRHRGFENTVDSANMVSVNPPSPLAAFVAFYSDVEHEALQITSGYRLTLTYKIYKQKKQYSLVPTFLTIKDNRPISAAGSVGADALKANLRAIIDNPRFLPKGGFFGFHLAHSCIAKTTPAGGSSERVEGFVTSLKGVDAVLYRVLRDDLNLSCSFEVLSQFEVEEDDSEDGHNNFPGELTRTSDGYVRFYTLSTRFGVVDREYKEGIIDRIGGTFVWDAGTGDNAPSCHQGGRSFHPVVWVGTPHPLNKTEEAYHVSCGIEDRTDMIYQRVCLVFEIEEAEVQ